MLTVDQVADYFLVLADSRYQRLDHLKLQKLCYFAQGFYMAFRKEPLFKEQLRAWGSGPAVRELYDQHHRQRGPLPVPTFDEESITHEQRQVIEAVLSRFGEYPSAELAKMTKGDMPWLEAYERRRWTKDDVIEQSAMTYWFKRRFADLDSGEAPPPPSEEVARKAFELFKLDDDGQTE